MNDFRPNRLAIPEAHRTFESFVALNEPRLRRGLVAAYGGERGREATAEALAYAWEHWERVSQMTNVVGYLYRVGQSKTRSRRLAVTFVVADTKETQWDPRLAPALTSLTERQRTAVVLIHGFGWSLREVSELTGTKITTIQNHLERGMSKLRSHLNGGSHE